MIRFKGRFSRRVSAYDVNIGNATVGIDVAGHGVGQLLGIDLAPGHRFARRRSAEAAGVGAGIGELQEEVVPRFVEAEDFLNLRLGLQQKILRRAAAEDQDAALSLGRSLLAPFGIPDDCRGIG